METPEQHIESLVVAFDSRAGLDMLDILRDEADSPEALEAYLTSLHDHKLSQLYACMLAVALDGQMAALVAVAADAAMGQRGMAFRLGGGYSTEADAMADLERRGVSKVTVVTEPAIPATIEEGDGASA